MKRIADNIIITVQPNFELEQSNPLKDKFVWSYQMTITNHSDDIIQLLQRYWRITNRAGHFDEVRGVGVVGLQPLILPDNTFTYTSYCQLSTPEGTMEGHYEMQTTQEKHFIVAIPKFGLSAPMPIRDMHVSKLH